MLKCSFAAVVFAALVLHKGGAVAQMSVTSQTFEEKVDGSEALDRALKVSTLTVDGKPFHAVMEIGSAVPDHSGRIEVWWVDQAKYRVMVTSPKFSQTKIVNGRGVQEKNDGDYYPRWLQDFVFVLIDPLPMAKNFRGSGAVMLGPQITRSCLRRDDRPGGITDQITWGEICFAGSEPRISSLLTFNHSMEFSDWKVFGKKQIARTYTTDVLDYKPVAGKLTKLEELKQPDEVMFAIATPTPPEQRISTEFVSTLKEESLVDLAPAIVWPPVREGKTEGYMIVYARTDRTGQVRETAKHNSDQPGLESFGMQEALKYKFKPLIVDGAAQQMEMPLVLHFSSKLEDPLPNLNAAEMKKQTIACDLTLASEAPKGAVVVFKVSVDEAGKVTGVGIRAPANTRYWLAAMTAVRSCKFAPYAANGKVTVYKGDVEVIAR